MVERGNPLHHFFVRGIMKKTNDCRLYKTSRSGERMKHCSFYIVRLWLSRHRCGFTLIELLIVIGLLGALAVLLLTSLNVDRTQTLDSSIVQKELSDIQRAFQRFKADCVPQQYDYKLMTRYGLEVLAKYDSARGWSFADEWDPARRRGWRGPYIESEGTRTVDTTDSDADGVADNAGQPVNGPGEEVCVVCTPYVNDEGCYDKSYYRVIHKAVSGNITELWVVFPSHSGDLPADPKDPDSYKNKRLLLLNE
jgi:prepilin-type N-terminal cleavage/methylation domain-containing protein